MEKYSECRNILRTFWKNCTKLYEKLLDLRLPGEDGIYPELHEAVEMVSVATPTSVSHGAGGRNL